MSMQDYRTCIFCDGKGLTKQHILPDWLKTILPREGQSHEQLITRTEVDENPPRMTLTPIKKNGHTWSRKARNVCGNCNSGWMSLIETKAKLNLTALISGDKTLLDEEAQLNLANWVTLSTIMAEYTDLQHKAISEDEQKEFYQHKKPLDNWKIWIGKYRGTQWDQRYRHHGLMTVKKNTPLPKEKFANTQASTFVLGELFIHATSSTEPLVELTNPYDLRHTMIPIWPLQRQKLRWPPIEVFTPTFSDEEVNTIADEVIHLYEFYNPNSEK
ncbi:hypothetical protein [Paenibacillus sp. WLX2291]|uniref:hypothetical protein n=1 Tax=Paenibacillus sp. WLX2291 TaxID=3296934 RepID=UPI00398460E0